MPERVMLPPLPEKRVTSATPQTEQHAQRSCFIVKRSFSISAPRKKVTMVAREIIVPE